MEITLDIEMPKVQTRQTRVVVTCGGSSIVLNEVGADHRKFHLSGGGPGDWIPDYDWRENYVLEDKLRRDFALPYRTMHNLAVDELKRREKARLIARAADKIGREVFADA